MALPPPTPSAVTDYVFAELLEAFHKLTSMVGFVGILITYAIFVNAILTFIKESK